MHSRLHVDWHSRAHAQCRHTSFVQQGLCVCRPVLARIPDSVRPMRVTCEGDVFGQCLESLVCRQLLRVPCMSCAKTCKRSCTHARTHTNLRRPASPGSARVLPFCTPPFWSYAGLVYLLKEHACTLSMPTAKL